MILKQLIVGEIERLSNQSNQYTLYNMSEEMLLNLYTFLLKSDYLKDITTKYNLIEKIENNEQKENILTYNELLNYY